MNDLTMQEGRYIASEEQRAAMQDTALTLQLDQSRISSGMNQLRINRPIPQASILESTLDGASSGLNFANAINNLTRTA